MKRLFQSALFITAIASVTLIAADAQRPGYKDTPKIPGQKWLVHDADRPHPKVVEPGTFSSEEKPGKPPSDAIVLFDGKDLSKWQTSDGGESKWKVENGAFAIVPKAGGDIRTKEEFGDMQLHIEFKAPNPTKGDSQGRGNSGIFLMGRYEFQVLDSYNNPTYADGQAASLYGMYPPLVNSSRKPGEWQVYDIAFTAPRFKDGKLESPAYVTAFHNGVLVQNHREYLGSSTHRAVAKYTPHPDKGPIRLQDHNDPVQFRNIWVRPIKPIDQE